MLKLAFFKVSKTCNIGNAVLCLVMFSSLWPRGPQPARLLCQWEVSRQECWSGLPYLRPGALAHPGIEPRSPALQTDSLPSEPPRKPMSTGVGSLCPLQGIFLIQGSSQGLSHCRPFFTNWATREAQIGSRFVWQIFFLSKNSVYNSSQSTLFKKNN